MPQHAVKRRRAGPPEAGSEKYRATFTHQVWAVDILYDATVDGRRLRILTVSDEARKACLAVVARRSLRAADVAATLARLVTLYGPPQHVRSDNGPEFVADAVRSCLGSAGVNSMFIKPGSLWQNPFAETLHARLRHELLNQELFTTVLEANVMLEDRGRTYNERRPHGALGMATPAEAVKRLAHSPA